MIAPNGRARVRTRTATAVGVAFLLLLGSPPTALSAQVSVGFKGGLSWSTVAADENVQGGRAGVAAGGFVEMPVVRTVAVRAEAMYAQRGARVGDFTYRADGDLVGIESYTERWSSDYVEGAALVHWTPGSESAEWRFGILAGGVLSHLVRQERVGGGGVQTQPLDLRSTSLGPVAGITATRSRFSAEARYQVFNDQRTSYGWMIHHYVAVLFGLRVL